jgi:hypothetical protein
MRIPFDLTYEVYPEDSAQRIDITGEREDVRGYLETLLAIIFPHEGPHTLRQAYSQTLDELEQAYYENKPITRNSYLQIGGVNMRIYYEPGIAGIHPWASKPSAHFTTIKEYCDRAWEKTMKTYATREIDESLTSSTHRST